MTSLFYFNPLTLKTLTSPDVQKWSKIYNLIGNAVGMNDRSRTLKQPIKLSINPRCELPNLTQTQLSYSDCADLRAKELYDLSIKLNKPLGIMWSGGIDSTTIVTSFLRNFSIAELKDRITIITGPMAILENPVFFKKYILPTFNLVSSEYMPWLFTGEYLLITGEMNDQLFGSDLIRGFLLKQGSGIINNPFSRDQIFNYIDTSIKDKEVTSILIDSVLASGQKYNITIEKNNDFFWWYNFCFKWQTVHHRIYALASPKFQTTIDKDWDANYLHHFFSTDCFQNWSISNPEVRYITDWKNYKLKSKEYIYEFDHNEHYFVNKIKRPSLYTVFAQRKLNEAVTEDFKILESYNPTEFYTSDNDFNT